MMPPPIAPPQIKSGSPSQRDDAIDVARSIAILGMFVIHAVLVLSASLPRSGPSAFVLWLCDGRAAATFVTLAGFGVTRLARKLGPETATPMLRRRALILWIAGCTNLIIWPGDILRVYGVALAAAPVMLQWSVRIRVAVSSVLIVAFALLLIPLDWTRHWDLSTLTYIGVWTPSGFVRNLFFDGFRPVVPWLAFFLLGTVLADTNLQPRRRQLHLLAGGAALTTTSVLASIGLDRLLVQYVPGVDALTREGVVGTTSLPPMPIFVLSAIGTTAVLLGATMLLLPHLPGSLRLMLSATGRRALTWYLVHVVVLVTLHTTALKNAMTATAAIAVGLGLFVVAALWSYQFRNTTGRLESLLRRLSDPRPDARRTRPDPTP